MQLLPLVQRLLQALDLLEIQQDLAQLFRAGIILGEGFLQGRDELLDVQPLVNIPPGNITALGGGASVDRQAGGLFFFTLGWGLGSSTSALAAIF